MCCICLVNLSSMQVRNDFLDLRVPVWVTDLGFVPGAASQPVIAVGTGHKQVTLQAMAKWWL